MHCVMKNTERHSFDRAQVLVPTGITNGTNLLPVLSLFFVDTKLSELSQVNDDRSNSDARSYSPDTNTDQI